MTTAIHFAATHPLAGIAASGLAGVSGAIHFTKLFMPAFRAQLTPKSVATLNNSVNSLSIGCSGASSLE